MANSYPICSTQSPLLLLVLVLLPGSVRSAAPTADELIRQAESFYTGSAGVVDEARAHELFEQAADTGEPRAILRVATLHQLGAGGFARDHGRAAALAAPVYERVLKLAGEGDATAQYLVGTVSLLGIGRTPDQRAALSWYERSGEGGNIGAMHNLGWMYGTGSGTEKDPEKAFSWYLLAAERGYASSMYEVGRSYLQGWGVVPDSVEGTKWLRQAAERRHGLAMAVLGGELMAGERLPQDLAEGLRWIKAAAEAGEVQGQYGLARAYLFALGVPRDGERARSLFREVAARDHPDAQAYVDWLERLGPGAEEGTRDQADLMAKAIVDGHEWADGILSQWLAKGMLVAEQVERVHSRLSSAADAGNPTAQAALGSLYYDGLLGEGRDFERALKFSRKAAAAGSGHGMRTLGHAYNKGQGVPQDRQKALAWWGRAAEAGDSYAMLWLGRAYTDGNGVARDLRRGLRLIEKAGNAGNYHAMKYLAQVYDSGSGGVAKDTARARHWYERLAAMGDEEARGWLRFQDLAGEE